MELTFKLTEQEAQVILNALVKETYAEVFEVIGNIQKQAGEQLDKETISE